MSAFELQNVFYLGQVNSCINDLLATNFNSSLQN